MPVRIVVLLFAISLAAAGRAAAPVVPRPVDDNGDPLPDGAAARLGSLAWRPGVALPDLAWSPDGKWLASADSHLHTARLWDAKSGRVVRTFWGHRGEVTSVSFSPDSTRLATSASDGTVRVWDVATGQQLLLLTGPSFIVPAAAFSGDGKTLVVLTHGGAFRTTQGGPVIRFDASTGAEIGRTSLEQGRSRVLSPRGDRVAMAESGREGRALVVLDAATGRRVGKSSALHSFRDLTFSPDGKRLAVGEQTGSAKVIDAETGRTLLSFEKDEAASDSRLSFTPDGRRVLVESPGGKLHCWHVATGKRMASFEGASRGVRARAFSPDGSRLVAQPTGAYGGMALRLWDATKGKLLAGDAGPGMIKALAFSPDGKHLLAAGHGGSARLWDIKTRRVVRELPLPGINPRMPVLAIAFSRDGKLAAAVAQDSPAIVWQVATAKVLHQLAIPKDRHCRSVIFSADGGVLFAAGQTGGVYRWDTKTGEDLDPLEAEPLTYFLELFLSKDGKTLLASSIGATARFDAATGKLRHVVKQKDPEAWLACVSPDQTRFVAYAQKGRFTVHGGDNVSLRTWQSAAAVLALRYSPDGQHVVGTSHRLLRIWDDGTGKELPPLVGEPGTVEAMAFSPDGKWLVTAGSAGTILLWDAAVIRRPPQHRPTPAEWGALWHAAGHARRDDFAHAQGLLNAGGDGTVARVRERLLPPPAFSERFARLVESLADEDAAVHNRTK